MTKTQEVLLELLAFHKGNFIDEKLQALNPAEIADVFVSAALAVSAMEFLKEQHWLQSQKGSHPEIYFKLFVIPLFNVELQPLRFLQEFFQSSSLEGAKEVSRKARQIEKTCLDIIKARPFSDQKEFTTVALNTMSQLFEFESQLQQQKKDLGQTLGLSMYRTFDHLDEVLNLTYSADIGMKTDLANKERLYEGAGVGVQSGYSTVLTALRCAQPPPGSRFIDLGSGYGRVGLVVGLLRPDMDFRGYEFVQHRVDIASATSDKLGLSPHVHFYTQDLSLKDFQIPEADIYYLYDPFSEETYGHVLSQLVKISRQQNITIITKGNAKAWLMEVVRREGWPDPEELDSGNLCLFRPRRQQAFA